MVQPKKSKGVAIALSIILGLWTWTYSYKYDSWKFWLNLILSFTLIWIPVAWIWAIIDVSSKDKRIYEDYFK